MDPHDDSISRRPVDRLGFFQSGGLKVKFCGITNPTDAALAVEYGADAIGVNFYEQSKRHVTLEEASQWLADVPVIRVAVVVNANADLIDQLSTCGRIDAIQFHGDESPEICARSPLPWIRAVRVESARSLEDALAYDTQAFLLDAFSVQGYGGTGHRLNWDLAAEFVTKNPSKRVIVAGGLTPDTVGNAVRLISPYGVDVASGIELPGMPRTKSGPLMKRFCEQALRFAKTGN